MAHPFTSHLRLFDKLLQEYAGIYASLETEVTELKAELKRERTAHAKTKEEHAEGQASFDRETAKFEAELRQERDLSVELRREIQVLSLRLHTNQKPQNAALMTNLVGTTRPSAPPQILNAGKLVTSGVRPNPQQPSGSGDTPRALSKPTTGKDCRQQASTASSVADNQVLVTNFKDGKVGGSTSNTNGNSALKAVGFKKSLMAVEPFAGGCVTSQYSKKRVAEEDLMHRTPKAPRTLPQSNVMTKSADTNGPTTLTNSQRAFLLALLRLFKLTKDGAWFAAPVDPVRMNIPTYFHIVTNPMDLRTMEKKLKDASYTSLEEVVGDFDLIVSNTLVFNGPEHLVTRRAQTIKAQFKDCLVIMRDLERPMLAGGAGGGRTIQAQDPSSELQSCRSRSLSAHTTVTTRSGQALDFHESTELQSSPSGSGSNYITVITTPSAQSSASQAGPVFQPSYGSSYDTETETPSRSGPTYSYSFLQPGGHPVKGTKWQRSEIAPATTSRIDNIIEHYFNSQPHSFGSWNDQSVDYVPSVASSQKGRPSSKKGRDMLARPVGK